MIVLKKVHIQYRTALEFSDISSNKMETMIGKRFVGFTGCGYPLIDLQAMVYDIRFVEVLEMCR